LALLDIAANVHAAERNGPQALKLAQRFVKLDPCSRRLKRMVSSLEVGKELNDLLEASPPIGEDASAGRPNMRDLLEDCVEQTAKVTSYKTVRRVTIETRGEQQQAEWHLVFEHPNRFEVYQRVGNNEDAWLTIDGETLHRLHLLAQAPPPEPGAEPAINSKLLVGTILDHLVSMRVERFGLSDVGCGYMVLVGTLPSVPPFAIELGASKGDECQIDVWIDKDFNKMLRLCKFTLRAGALEFEQAFAGYNDTRVSLEEFS
jgi:hypothetical protein